MVQIARDVASVADLQMRMQGIVLLGAFLKLTPYGRKSGMTDDQVYAGVEKALRKYFGKRGDRVVQDNMTCVKRGYQEMQEVPQEHDSSAEAVIGLSTDQSRIQSLNVQRYLIWPPTTNLPSMNEANERDPYNNNRYGTLVDCGYKLVTLPILDVRRFQRADHPRLRRRHRREGAAGRSVGRPLADSRRHGDAARFQLHRPGHPGVHSQTTAPAAWTA